MIPASQLQNRDFLNRERASLEKRFAIYKLRLAECNAALSALDEPDDEPDETPDKEKTD